MTKTNLSVHEDKNRVPFVKVSGGMGHPVGPKFPKCGWIWKKDRPVTQRLEGGSPGGVRCAKGPGRVWELGKVII